MNNPNSKPVFSVVMPMYNVSRYVKKAIDSVLAQSYSNFELICVNDGCTDNTVEIVKAYNDPRIRLIHQKNRGLSAARNTGINHSRGLYVALLDSDDYWTAGKLLTHYKHFGLNSRLGISYSASTFVDENNNDLGIGQYPRLHNITPEYIFCRNPIGNGSAAVIRRSMLMAMVELNTIDGEVRHTYFDETMRQSEDVEFWLRAALTSDWIFEGVGKPLTFYRVNTSGLSANLQKQFDAWRYSVKKNWHLDPVFFETWYSRAAAYQKRYLARRAIQSRNALTAIKLIHSALITDWRIIRDEPVRTGITWGCALLSVLPERVYSFIEKCAMRTLRNKCTQSSSTVLYFK